MEQRSSAILTGFLEASEAGKDKTGSIRQMPENKAGKDFHSWQQRVVGGLFKSQHRQATMEIHILCHGSRPACFSFSIIEIGALAIVEIKAKEFENVLGMAVFHNGALIPNERFWQNPPAITKLAVLSGGRIELCIKPSARNVVVTHNGDVVARKKIRISRIGVEVFVNHLEYELARLGEDVAFQPVEGRATNQSLGMFAQSSNQFFQPGRRGEAVVVGEGEEFASRLRDAPVARSSRTCILLAEELEIEICGPSRGIERERHLAAIVHHNHLEASPRQCLRRQRVKTRFYGLRAVASGNDDTNKHWQL